METHGAGAKNYNVDNPTTAAEKFRLQPKETRKFWIPKNKIQIW